MAKTEGLTNRSALEELRKLLGRHRVDEMLIDWPVVPVTSWADGIYEQYERSRYMTVTLTLDTAGR